MENLVARPSNKLNIQHRKVLNAYFATRKEEVISEKKESLYKVISGDTLSKIAKKHDTTVSIVKKDNSLKSDIITIGQKLKVTSLKEKGKKVSFQYLNAANLGDEVYIIVKTHLIGEGKKVWVNVRQGVTTGVVKENGTLLLMQNGKEQARPEAIIGGLCNEPNLLNADDFKDWAVFKITLGGKDTSSYAAALDKLKGKITKLYLVVDAHSPNNDRDIVYNGMNPDKDGEPDQRSTPNQWLDMDDKWFKMGVKSGVLEEMKIIVDKHIKYSQTGVRNSLSKEGLKNLDCSETVAIYLHKLGVMPNLKILYTGTMTTEKDFQNAVGSKNIELISGSDKENFKPQKGDVFVWRKSNGVGHTGIVYHFDEKKDLVTILEAIGKVGSADEKTNKNNGGYTGTNCSRTAVYKRKGKALFSHSGWVGYFRPKNYTKKL